MPVTAPDRRHRRWALSIVVAALTVVACGGGDEASDTGWPEGSAPEMDATTPAADGDAEPEGGDGGDTTATDDEPTGPRADEDYDGWVNPASAGQPWSSTVEGLLTFRGNPTRSWYGAGPVPTAPEVLWSRPDGGGYCGQSTVGGETTTWCGTGWTGQPAVWDDGDVTWVGFGAYDQNVHFLDAADGADLLPPFPMGDIIKGSVTRDPDGFPLLYSGSRADFHVLATDRDEPVSLWSMSGDDVSPTKWNNDWDSSPLVIDDFLFEGGENGQFFIVRLNRATGADGLVTVDPEIVFHAPGWDDELTDALAGSGSRQNDVSIENSLVVVGDTVYFSNSGGLVQGWDIGGLLDGETPERVFRYWTGDDTDATLVADTEGMLYVAQEVERASSAERNAEVGQLIKLDPSRPDDPLVWSIADDDGLWATPALVDGVVIAPTHSGRVIGADSSTGEILWEKQIAFHAWSSPVVVDDVWIHGDCDGHLRAYDVADPRTEPSEIWSVALNGCVESTPAVWDGRIYVGARGGMFYAIGDP